MNSNYYTLNIKVRPGWTLPDPGSLRLRKNVLSGYAGYTVASTTRWKELPHVVFANVDSPGAATAAKILQFAKTYGVLEDLETGDPFEMFFDTFGYAQDKFRYAWRERDAKTLWFPFGAEQLYNYEVPFVWSTARVLCPADVLTYMKFLLTRDLAGRRARICANKTCATPYFIAKRNNQIFCAHSCANLVTQRNFRKRRK
jgi:hypothetical protein